jgi:hypothetical protein
VSELIGLADILGLILVLCVLYLGAIVARRRLIGRHGGTFEFSLRLSPGAASGGWAVGIGRYSGDHLEWFRTFSVSPRPSRSWTRDDLRYAGRRERTPAEEYAIYPDHVIVRCDGPSGSLEFAMALTAVTGFLAWLEASPPGRGHRPII